MFALSISATALAIIVGFGYAVAACAEDLSDAIHDATKYGFAGEDVRPIAIPPTACPYLERVDTSAREAGQPWADAGIFAPQPSVSWPQFRAELRDPLARFDDALTAAIPRVPAPVADDLRTVEDKVRWGRLALSGAHSVEEYTSNTDVFGGYAALAHADALIGGACNVDIAPLP